MVKLNYPIKLSLIKDGKIRKTTSIKPMSDINSKRFLYFRTIREHVAAGRSALPALVKKDKKRDDGKYIKKPVIPWLEFQTRLPTDADIQLWEKGGRGRQPVELNAVVLVTGRISGVWVLDVDNPEAIKWAEENAPDTLIKALSGHGQHWYYKMPAEGYIKSDTNVLNGAPKGVDIRGDGGMIVAPPSTYDPHIPIFYRWIGYEYPYSPPQEEWEALPVWEGPQGISSRYENIHDDIIVEDSESSDIIPHDPDGDNIISEGDRHQTLIKRVGSWIRKGLNKAAVLKVALEWNAKHCVPPEDKKAVETTVNSLYEKDKKSNGLKNVRLNEEEVLFTTPPPAGVDTLSETDPVPESLLKPGGVIQQFMDYVEKASTVHVPLFAAVGGMVLLGTLLGGKVTTQTGLKTNLYLITLAPSGDGKNSTLDAIKLIFNSLHFEAGDNNIGFKSLKGPDNLASDAAIFSILQNNPVQLMLFDEVGDFFGKISQYGSSVSGVPKALKELYSCPDTGYSKAFADVKRNINITWHNLSFYGTGIPATFWNVLNINDLYDGFLARNLIFQHEYLTKPEKNENICKHIPAQLRKSLEFIYNIKFNKCVYPIYKMRPEPHTILKTEKACTLAREASNRYDILARENRDENENIFSVYTRSAEHVEKLALIHAVSLECGIPEFITHESVEYAIALLDYCVPRFIAAAGKHIGFNPPDRLRRKVLSLVKRRGFVTVRDVYRNIRGCNPREAEDAMKILTRQGYVEKGIYKRHVEYRLTAEAENELSKVQGHQPDNVT
jgi:hypothetical protein